MAVTGKEPRAEVASEAMAMDWARLIDAITDLNVLALKSVLVRRSEEQTT